MNVLQLENKLAELDIFPTAREICSVIDMNEQSYSRKKKAETDIKQGDIRKIEQYYNISLDASISTDIVNLKYYEDAYAAAGNGGFGSDNFTLLDVNKNFIHNYNSNYEYSVINCVGNSMEPLLMPSDLLIVRHCNYIIDNKIHVFYYDSKLYVKYLSNNLNQIVVRSLNADYPVRYIDNDINVLGVVSGLVRWL